MDGSVFVVAQGEKKKQITPFYRKVKASIPYGRVDRYEESDTMMHLNLQSFKLYKERLLFPAKHGYNKSCY